MDIQVTSEELEIIAKILKHHFPEASFYVFGSRCSNRAEQYSDLDLAIDNNSTLSLSKLSSVKEKLAESNLKFLVDITDLQAVTPEFRNHILNTGVLFE